MLEKIIISLEPTLNEALSDAIEIPKNATAVIQVEGLALGEKAYLERESFLSPGTFKALKLDGVQPYFDENNDTIVLDFPGCFKVRKDETVAEVGVAVIGLRY